MARVQFRLSDELYNFVQERSKNSKITPSEYIRLLIVRDIDDATRSQNLALDEVNKTLDEMQNAIKELQRLKAELTTQPLSAV